MGSASCRLRSLTWVVWPGDLQRAPTTTRSTDDAALKAGWLTCRQVCVLLTTGGWRRRTIYPDNCEPVLLRMSPKLASTPEIACGPAEPSLFFAVSQSSKSRAAFFSSKVQGDVLHEGRPWDNMARAISATFDPTCVAVPIPANSGEVCAPTPRFADR